ncbi:hypothetical protein ACIA98_43300 [Streptomyces sp. NPDC051366]|uniref:hypothetical protein n=1 Tax=Streptomyces sp. NPDC051366 TaxID=3365652 RepID=UPI0037ABC2CF
MSYTLTVSLKRMSALLRALYRAAGVGTHELSVTYLREGDTLWHACTVEGPDLDDDSEDPDLHHVAMLLLRTALNGGMAVVALRTPLASGSTVVRVWQVHDLAAYPLTAGQSFSAYCVGLDGELQGPEPGMEYYDAPTLTL